LAPADTVKTDHEPWFRPLLRNVTSQFGEDGVIERALAMIGAREGWCVEFGAWDGVHLSNTHNLVANLGFSAILIESDKARFRSLQKTFAGNPKVTPLHRFVGFDSASGLDALLRGTPMPRTFDVLSVDIDGNDYHVWAAVQEYRARLVVIEYNPSIPDAVDFVQPADPRIAHGSSLRALVRLANQKGYELIAVTAANALFVERDYFPRFKISDNSIEALRAEAPPVSYVFQGYDGTIHLAGNDRLIWHDVPINRSRLQQLPRFFRKYPDNFSLLTRFLWKLYRRWRAR
jgi:hypothetical protein